MRYECVQIKPQCDDISKFTNLIIVFMALLLNQTNYFFGINFSFADLICIILLLKILISKKALIPVAPTLFFLLTSILVIFTAVFYVPNKLEFSPNLIEVMSNYIKLFATFIYFIVGNNLARLNCTRKIIKWFSIGALILGVIAFVFTVFKIKLFSNLLYDSGIRFKGLMGDPNYFSILQICAIAYFININNIKSSLRYVFIFFLLISILVSGSKTGVITLIMYFLVLKPIDNLFNIKIKYKTIILSIFIIIFLILIIPYLSYKIDRMLIYASERIPALNRISVIFTDFNTAVSGSGSGRDLTWSIALKMIELSPLIGIGVGTYTGLSNQYWNVNTVAHNTYLQLSVEWGLPLVMIFFFYVFIIIGKVSFIQDKRTEQNIILRDMIFAFLIGSLAISLNNARMFWMFLGALVYEINSVSIGENEKV